MFSNVIDGNLIFPVTLYLTCTARYEFAFTAASFARLFPVTLFFDLNGVGYPELHLKWTVFLGALNRTFTVRKSCPLQTVGKVFFHFLPS